MTLHDASLAGPGPWAGISTAAIAHNLAWLRRRVQTAGAQAGAGGGAGGAPGSPPRLWAVVKADAYGHGLHHALAAAGAADGVCVSDLDDAWRVRRQGWQQPVLVLSAWGLRADTLRDPALGELHVVIDDPATLHTIASAAPGLPQLHVWLRHAGHLYTLGFAGTAYTDAFQRLHARAQAGALAGVGHLHHYAAAENADTLAVERQAFATAAAGLPGPHCTGNSAALCGGAAIPVHAQDQWLRCGLALYGASALPGVTGPQLGLRPAMSLRARLLNVQHVAPGQTVGYGGSFRATQATCIGVVGIGYGHGVPRQLWQRGGVLAGRHGRRVPLAGRVAMDCLTVDLGAAPPEAPGDIITLWGHAPGGACLPVEEAAQACDTIAAELLTGLTARTPLITE